ncbi:hypothetical protein UFOVP610_16 [uncultured Caudovirales phage]|uniref:Uncharacterized protein n=1 Tax=uncultured Caudovirales phage TaxID=2100421 RepID=A0A6J5N1J2_9CAUD|nr:hypothetical protein UFOVP610_16 [uncultured Caudovirales phage]
MNALAQIPKQIIIKKNNTAPFEGVLIPGETYKQMQIHIEKKDSLQEQLLECYHSQNKIEESDNSAIWFSSGLVVGIISAVFIQKLK